VPLGVPRYARLAAPLEYLECQDWMQGVPRCARLCAPLVALEVQGRSLGAQWAGSSEKWKWPPDRGEGLKTTGLHRGMHKGCVANGWSRMESYRVRDLSGFQAY